MVLDTKQKVFCPECETRGRHTIICEVIGNMVVKDRRDVWMSSTGGVVTIRCSEANCTYVYVRDLTNSKT